MWSLISSRNCTSKALVSHVSKVCTIQQERSVIGTLAYHVVVLLEENVCGFHHLLVYNVARQKSVQRMAILTFGQMNKRQGIPSIELLRQQAPGHDGFHVVGVSALEATEILYNKCI